MEQMKKNGIERLNVEITARPKSPCYGPAYVDVEIQVTAPALKECYLGKTEKLEYAPVKEETSLTPEGEAMYENGIQRAITNVTFRAYEELFSKMPELDGRQTDYSYVSKSMEGFADALAEKLRTVTATKINRGIPRQRVDDVLALRAEGYTWFNKEDIRKIQNIASNRQEQIAKAKRKQEYFTNKTINYTCPAFDCSAQGEELTSSGSAITLDTGGKPPKMQKSGLYWGEYGH